MPDFEIFSWAANINNDVFAFPVQLAAKLLCGMFAEEGMLNLNQSRRWLWHSELADQEEPFGHRPTKKGQELRRPALQAERAPPEGRPDDRHCKANLRPGAMLGLSYWRRPNFGEMCGFCAI